MWAAHLQAGLGEEDRRIAAGVGAARDITWLTKSASPTLNAGNMGNYGELAWKTCHSTVQLLYLAFKWYVPAIPSPWMESSGWRQDSLEWAHYAYQQLLEPRLSVRGRMALVFLFAFIWAFTWYVPRCDV
jgi:hypothetical protein